MKDQILDHPEAPTGIDYARQTWDHRLNSIDYIVNLVLVAIVAIGSLSGIVNVEAIFLALVGMFGLGVYQLLSGLIGAIRGNRDKLIYLLAAIGYLIVSFLVGFIMDQQGIGGDLGLSIFGLGLVISFIGGCYYTYLCYQAKQRTAL